MERLYQYGGHIAQQSSTRVAGSTIDPIVESDLRNQQRWRQMEARTGTITEDTRTPSRSQQRYEQRVES